MRLKHQRTSPMNSSRSPEKLSVLEGKKIPESSSGSCSSSSSESSTDDEALEGLAASSDNSVTPPWREGCIVLQHARTRTLHLQPVAEPDGPLVRGRKKGNQHRIYPNSLVPDAWKCAQCEQGHPIRTIDLLAEALGRAVKPRREG